MKRGLLSNAEKEMIRTSGKTVEELSLELDRDISTIQKYMPVKDVKDTQFNRSIGKHKDSRGKTRSVVMTPGASELGDTQRQAFKSRYHKNIHKCMGEE